MAVSYRTPRGNPYFVDGEGRAVVFVHGVLMDHRMWGAQSAELSRSYRVIRLDMLGHGEAPDPPGPRTLGDFVSQVDDVISHACAEERPVLAGFSMGGLVAQAYAIERAAALRGLIIMNAVYGRTPGEREAVRSRLATLERDGIEGMVSAARARWFRPEEREAFAAPIEEIVAWLREGDVRAKTKAYRVFATADPETAGRLGRITCPTLVMTGDGDAGSPPHMAEAMAREIPGARLAILDRQQHMMPILDAERVNRLIREFIASS